MQAQFAALRVDEAGIEQEIGQPVKWIEPPGKKSCFISLYQHNCDVADRSDWDSQHAWLLQQLQAFRACLAPRVKALPSFRPPLASDAG